MSSLGFIHDLRTGQLAPDTVRGTPLDMDQYTRVSTHSLSWTLPLILVVLLAFWDRQDSDRRGVLFYALLSHFLIPLCSAGVGCKETRTRAILSSFVVDNFVSDLAELGIRTRADV